MALADGIYKLVWGADVTQSMDVVGGSGAVGARVQTYPRNDSDAQRFVVTNDGSTATITTGASRARVALCGVSIDYPGDLLLGVRQGGSSNNQWVIEDTSEQVYLPDMKRYVQAKRLTLPVGTDTYAAAGATSRLMSSGGDVEAGEVYLEMASGQTVMARQQWVPVVSWFTDPSCATVGRCCVSEGTVTSSDVLVVDTNPHIINLLAQIPAGYTPVGKARWRSRYTEDDEVHDWSAWQTVQGAWSGGEDLGWGEPWVPCQFATTEVEGQTYAIVGCAETVTLPANSKIEYECEVALLSPNDLYSGAFTLGAVRSFACRIQSAVEVTDGDAVVAYDGLKITYYTDMRKNFASARVVVRDMEGNVLNAGTTKAPATARWDTITIPWSRMSRMVLPPEQLDIELTLVGQDGIASVDRDTWTTSYEGDHGNEIDPNVEVRGARIRIWSTSEEIPTGTRVWISWRGTTEQITNNFQQNRDYWAIPPIGVPYTIWFVWNNPQTLTGWASNAYVGTLNPQPAGWFVDALDLSWELPIRVNLKEAPSLTVEYEPETEEESVMNRRRPLVTFGNVTKKSWSIEAILTEMYGDDMTEQLDAFEKCAEGTHAWFRDDRGMRERVAITGGEIDRSRLHDYPIKLDMQSEVI